MRIAILQESSGAESFGELRERLAPGGHEVERSPLDSERATALLAWADCVFVVGSCEVAFRAWKAAAELGRPCSVSPSLEVQSIHRQVIALKAQAERARRAPFARRVSGW